MDSAFNLNTFLRFILPGAVCGLAMVLLIDTCIIVTSESSFVRIVRHARVAVEFTLALIPASFAFGVVLNALTFQQGYSQLAKLFAKRKPHILELEQHLYKLVLAQTTQQYASSLDQKDELALRDVLWENKRGAFMGGLDGDILERLDDRYSPYADFQLGLGISISLLWLVGLLWLDVMDYQALAPINRSVIAGASTLFSIIVVFTLIRGAYANYAKLRGMRLVMVISLAGLKQNEK
ncbi:MAG TPA: hypothetical protein VF006_15485 [Longimicrobium sp.]